MSSLCIFYSSAEPVKARGLDVKKTKKQNKKKDKKRCHCSSTTLKNKELYPLSLPSSPPPPSLSLSLSLFFLSPPPPPHSLPIPLYCRWFHRQPDEGRVSDQRFRGQTDQADGETPEGGAAETSGSPSRSQLY